MEKSNSLFTLSNLRLDKNLPEIFVVTSGKGGVGKTFMSVNLAILLKQLKKNILLIDADIHLGNVDLFLGLRPKFSMEDIYRQNMDLRNIIISGPGGIDILPATSAVKDLLNNEEDFIRKIGNAFGKLEHEYDIVVVDTGAGVARSVLSFVLGADKIIVIVTPDPASIADAYGMIKIIRQFHDVTPVVLVANMVTSEEEGRSLYNKMNLMVQRFLKSEIHYGGVVLQDPLIPRSIKSQQPAALDHPHSMPVNLLKIITRKLLRLPSQDTSQRAGFFDRFIVNRNIKLREEDE